MDEQLKQRVVGAIVLVSVGIVLIPMLLRGPPSGAAGVTAPVALNPSPVPEGFSSRVVPLDSRDGSNAAAEHSGPSPREPTLSPDEPPPVAEAPRGWAVQLASFSSPHNALALRDRLKALGYSAFVETAGEGRERVTRVIVGPVRERERAATSLAGLQRATELSGIVVRYPSE